MWILLPTSAFDREKVRSVFGARNLRPVLTGALPSGGYLVADRAISLGPLSDPKVAEKLLRDLGAQPGHRCLVAGLHEVRGGFSTADYKWIRRVEPNCPVLSDTLRNPVGE